MGDRLLIAISMISVTAVGFATLVAARRRLARDYFFLDDFGDRFAAYAGSDGTDSEAYTWLIQNSNKMQNALGPLGVYAMFRPPAANYQIPNYPIILNMLPELRKALSDQLLSHQLLSHRLAPDYHSAIGECLLRYAGSLDQRKEVSHANLRNPLVWLREGVRWLLSLPFALLGWVGLLSTQRAAHLSRSGLVRILAAIVTLVGLISGTMGIVLGWTAFSEWVVLHIGRFL